MPFTFPKVYPILDSSFIPTIDRIEFLRHLGKSLAGSGVTLLEYRNKKGTDAEIQADAEVLRSAMPPGQVKLILNDRADLVDMVNFDGVHVDAGDISPTQARKILGTGRIIGTFGGSDSLLPGALNEPVDYLAVGPVYETRTKQTDKRPIGPAGVRRLRQLTGPQVVLTAAAGITFETAQAVLDAGANTVAVSAGIFGAADPAAEFKRWMKHLA